MGQLPLKEHLKRELRLLKDAPAGRRFQRRYKRMLSRNQTVWGRLGRILASGLVALAGFAMLALPGPGILVIVLGLAMLAGEFSWMARWMDRCEVKLRDVWNAAERAWSRAGWAPRATVILGACVLVGTLGVGAYQLLFG